MIWIGMAWVDIGRYGLGMAYIVHTLSLFLILDSQTYVTTALQQL